MSFIISVCNCFSSLAEAFVVIAKMLCVSLKIFPNGDEALVLPLHPVCFRNHYFLLLVCPLIPQITELPQPALCPDLPHAPYPLSNRRPQDYASDFNTT